MSSLLLKGRWRHVLYCYNTMSWCVLHIDCVILMISSYCKLTNGKVWVFYKSTNDSSPLRSSVLMNSVLLKRHLLLTLEVKRLLRTKQEREGVSSLHQIIACVAFILGNVCWLLTLSLLLCLSQYYVCL